MILAGIVHHKAEGYGISCGLDFRLNENHSADTSEVTCLRCQGTVKYRMQDQGRTYHDVIRNG